MTSGRPESWSEVKRIHGFCDISIFRIDLPKKSWTNLDVICPCHRITLRAEKALRVISPAPVLLLELGKALRVIFRNDSLKKFWPKFVHGFPCLRITLRAVKALRVISLCNLFTLRAGRALRVIFAHSQTNHVLSMASSTTRRALPAQRNTAARET